jgi:hypothetical protein
MAGHGWPYFGLTTTLNVAICCASLTRIWAGQHQNELVMGTTVDHYGSEGGRLMGSRATLTVHRAGGEVRGMAGPNDEVAAGADGRRLRASHADREQVIDVLKAAFVQGRLDRDELDLRVGQVLASRTYADLAAVTADIPAGLTRARPPEPARESVSKKAVAAVAGATAALAGVLAATWTVPGHPLGWVIVIVILLVAVPTGWLVLLHDWLDKRAGRQAVRRLPPGAGGEPSQRPASADSRRSIMVSSTGC